MQAVVQHGVRDIRTQEWPEPRPQPGEALLAVRSVTICASDIHIYAEGNVGGVSWDQPFVPGHEAAGVVEDPRETDLPAGALVVLDPAKSCGSCDMCASGRYHLCRSLEFLDLPPLHGAMRERIAWSAERLFPIAKSVDVVEAPLIEPLAVAVHALERASKPAGANVLIAGCGAIGLFALQMARVRGAATVIATDLVEERLEVARALGADATVRVDVGDPVAEVLRAADGRNIDLAVEAAGPPQALQQCLEIVRPAGEVVVIGIPSEDEYRLSASLMRRKEVTISMVRRQNENYPEAVELVRAGQVQLGPLLTHRFPAAQAAEAFALAERKADGAVRVAVTF
jgi:L-iditol 2-dehydrogenase